MSVTSGDVMSSGHHDLDLALKSPTIIIKDRLSPLTKVNSQNLIRIHQIQLLIDLEIDR